ncbi:dihydrofolate reductase [Azoarcus sp. CIB]|uniref:dihydrofolate reductase n=1 Tax=Aromatoleum sp. (strain CIB) TaxID=198107 RepID=UPI00067B60F5|nr:dihydrofolate reductase [Azoarcus sp. CIB]AKU13087.1 dihydrofolate reductase [Azoarcus sp. CIB]
MNTTRPEVVLIAAVARNWVIGRNNALPWRLKADLAHFKATTVGHPVLMGRKTWESLGRPLPGRRNLVVTRDSAYAASGAEVFASLDAALAAAGDGKVFVIGGAEIYRQLLERADGLVLTEVGAEVDGDAFFPDFDRSRFTETRRESHAEDANNEFAFDFVEYRRKS